jgi:predicted membrane chloride channel (bestrophin family)
MIHYNPGRFQLAHIWQLKGSIFPKSALVAMPAAILAVLLSFSGVMEDFTSENVGVSPSTYMSFASVIGFLLVFRTSQAYTRFWEGATLVHQMRAEWLDAASQLFVFMMHSKRPSSEIDLFQHLLVRLFSLLHSAALQQIADMEDEDFEVIDVAGLDDKSIRFLGACEKSGVCKAEVLFYWLHRVIVENMADGVMPIPAPIMTRVFQELSNGMVKFHECVKLHDTPFPFPYAQMTSVLLLIHWCTTPIVMAVWAPHYVWAGIMTFVSIFCMWGITFIAGELEMPFGDDDNDLPTRQLQEEINHSLLNLLNPEMNATPQLSPNAVLDLQRLKGLGTMEKRRNSLEQTILQQQLQQFQEGSFPESGQNSRSASRSSKIPSHCSSSTNLEVPQPDGSPRLMGSNSNLGKAENDSNLLPCSSVAKDQEHETCNAPGDAAGLRNAMRSKSAVHQRIHSKAWMDDEDDDCNFGCRRMHSMPGVPDAGVPDAAKARVPVEFSVIPSVRKPSKIIVSIDSAKDHPGICSRTGEATV